MTVAHALALALLFLACNGAAPRRPAAPAPAGGPAVILHAEGRAPVRVRVEVVDTPETRARGLMFRDRLDEDAGMLFHFERSEVQTFWMKNTRIPLDMIFIDGGRVLGVVEAAEPYSEEPRSVGAPSRFVLEVNAGFARAHGIGAGAKVELAGVR